MRGLLLESNRGTKVNVSGGLTSLFLHASLIGFAVLATQVTPQLIKKVEQHDLVFLEQKVEPPKPPVILENLREAVAAVLPEGFKTLQTPINIPDNIPPVDITQAVTRAEDWTGRGKEGGVAGGLKGLEASPVPTKETYSVLEVDEAPIVLSTKVTPRYPDILRASGVEGEVVAEFVVDTLGRADLSSFHTLRETHSLFTAAVKAALSQMRFTPARMGEHKVQTRVQMPFSFKIEREE